MTRRGSLISTCARATRCRSPSEARPGTGQDLSWFLFREPGHPERDNRFSHRQFLGKLQTDRVGQVVEHRAVREEVVLLVQEPDVFLGPAPLVDPGFRHVHPVIADEDVHLPARRFDDPGDDPGERGLARPALPDNPEDLFLCTSNVTMLTAFTTPRSTEMYRLVTSRATEFFPRVRGSDSSISW